MISPGEQMGLQQCGQGNFNTGQIIILCKLKGGF